MNLRLILADFAIWEGDFRGCLACGKIIVRRRRPPESRKNWARHQYCDRACKATAARRRGGSVAQRIWEGFRDRPSNECWEWTRYRDKHGYGRLRIGPQTHLAHRYFWVLSGRELDPELTLDHLCRNTSCVNPAHLEQVTARLNWERSYTARLLCAHGHWMFDARIRNGVRRCRECDRQGFAKQYLRKKAVA